MRLCHLIPLLVFVLGASCALLVFGFGIANPLNTRWMTGDTVTMQFGWTQYRDDPTQMFSLTTNRASWPLPMHVALFDNVPLVAFMLRPIAQWLPRDFQYLGPLFVVGAGLQAVFGWLLLREATRDRQPHPSRAHHIALAIVALFFATAPMLYVRFFMGHPALTQHWTLLAALWLYTRASRVGVGASVVGFALLLGGVGGINPYLLVMNLLIYAAFVLHMARRGGLTWAKWCALVMPIAVASVALVAFGFFDPASAGVLPGVGYGYFSANMNALMNPMPDYLGSSLLPPLPLASPLQYEGYGYLGLGALAVVVVGVVLALRRGEMPAPLLMTALIALLIALSRNVTFGREAVAFPLPEVLLNVLIVFRSSGRFIWVVGYILLFIGLASLIRAMKPRHALAALTCAALLQMADLAGPLWRMHQRFALNTPIRFTDPIYAHLGRANDTLLVMPPWQCGPWSYKRGITKLSYAGSAFEPFSRLAADNHLRTNSFYAGRLPMDQAHFHCEIFPLRFATNAPDRRTVYLLSLDAFDRYADHLRTTHYCDFADDFFICRADLGKIGVSPRAARARQLIPTAQNFHIAL